MLDSDSQLEYDFGFVFGSFVFGLCVFGRQVHLQCPLFHVSLFSKLSVKVPGEPPTKSPKRIGKLACRVHVPCLHVRLPSTNSQTCFLKSLPNWSPVERENQSVEETAEEIDQRITKKPKC